MTIWHWIVIILAPSMIGVIWLSFYKIPGKNCMNHARQYAQRGEWMEFLMADTPKTAPLLKNTAAAPFVYFDGAPAFGCANGLVEIELSARVLMPKADNTASIDMVSVAHLRGSPAAVTNLRDALSKALDMLNGEGQAKH